MYTQTSITLDYEVNFKRKLGSGMHGVVFECLNKISKKKYAVKLIPDTEYNRREVEMQQLFSASSNIVKIVDVYENWFKMGKTKPKKKCLFIVMELMEYGDLYSLIENFGYFSETQGASIFKQIANGIQEMHKDGIVHGDIKPENILVHKEQKRPSLPDTLTQYKFKISDFGTAFEERKGAPKVSFTPFYVAPEVLLQDSNWNTTPNNTQEHTQTSKSDVWSLGTLLFLLLTGAVPFALNPATSDMTQDIFNATTEGKYHREDYYWKDLSPEAKDLFEKIFKVNPEERLTLDQVLVHPWLLKH